MSFKAIHGDCLQKMKDISSNSVDLILCDLPYGCLTGGGGQEKKRRRFLNGKDTGTEIVQKEGVIAGCSWDIPIDLEAFWVQVERIAKNKHTPVIHFCNTRFGYDLIKSKESWFRYDLIWEKTNGVGFLSANKMPMRSHENIYVFSKAGAYYNRIDISGNFKEWKQFGEPKSDSVYGFVNRNKPVIQEKGTITSSADKRCVKSVITVANRKKRGGHPTQKPEELYAWLIERYCPPGGTVLDPTAGSFTSCKVAKALGRHAIGIEMNKEFYEKYKST